MRKTSLVVARSTPGIREYGVENPGTTKETHIPMMYSPVVPRETENSPPLADCVARPAQAEHKSQPELAKIV